METQLSLESTEGKFESCMGLRGSLGTAEFVSVSSRSQPKERPEYPNEDD